MALNSLDQPSELVAAIRAGQWDQVLPMIYDLRLPYALLADLYEQIIFELVEGREVEAAGQLIAQGRTEGQDITSDQHGRAVMHRMRMDEPQRYFRLESIVRSPHFDRDQVYQEGMTRDKRRTQIARALVAQLHDAPSSRLLSLLSQALRYQQLQGVLPEGQQYDLFREVSHEQQQPELYPTRMHGQIKFPKGAFPTCAAFTPDGQSLVTGSVDGFLEVWNFATCKVRKDLAYQAADKFMIHKSAVLCVSFTVDGLFMASGDRGGNIKVWDLRTGVCVENFGKVHEKSVVALQFSKKGQKILSCSQDETVRIHGRQSRTTLITFRGHQSYVNDCVWTHDELHAVSCSSDGTVRVWNVAQGDCVSTFHPGAGALYEATISAIALHPTQDQIFVCNHSPEIGLFSLDGKVCRGQVFFHAIGDTHEKGVESPILSGTSEEELCSLCDQCSSRLVASSCDRKWNNFLLLCLLRGMETHD